jgi:DNA-binding MarR family transcriptional regulator
LTDTQLQPRLLVVTTTIAIKPPSTAWHEVAESGEGLAYEDFLSLRLGRLNTLMQRAMTRRYIEPAGLTHPEWRVLARLAAQESIEMSQLTRISLMDKAAISRSVESLLSKGLAERHTHPVNAKRRIVSLTPAGRRLVRKLMPQALREQARLLRLLEARERDVLDHALARLTHALLADEAAALPD